MDDPSALDRLESDPGWESVRIIFSVGDERGIPADLGGDFKGATVTVPAIKGPHLVFHSADIAREIFRGEPSVVAIDHTISFDSNFAEMLRSVFNGGRRNTADYDRVVAVLRLKALNQWVQFDMLPFLLENVRFARIDKKNDRPLNTIIAFRMIDYLDWDALRSDVPSIRFNQAAETLRETLKVEADAYLKSLFTDAELVSRRHRQAAMASVVFVKVSGLPSRSAGVSYCNSPKPAEPTYVVIAPSLRAAESRGRRLR